MPNKESFIPREWFEKGDKDLRASRILLNEGENELAAFHLQQAIEKYLKGYLLSKGWKLKRTHDLIDLLNEAVNYDKNLEDFRSLCEKVTEYYVEERYPFIVSKLRREEVEDSLKKATDFINRIQTSKE